MKNNLFKMPSNKRPLQRSKPLPIGNLSKITKKSGTYLISEKKGNTSHVIYVGQANNIRNRTKQHLQSQELAIDRKIQRTSKSRLTVQCITGKNARHQEQKEIEKVRKATGRRPLYNKINGISR